MRSRSTVSGHVPRRHSTYPTLLLFCFALMIAPPVSFAAGGGGGGAGQGGGGNSPGSSSSGPAGAVPLPMDLIRGCTATDHAWMHADNLELSRLYNKGAWEEVQGKLEGFIRQLKCTDNTTPDRSFHDHFPSGASFSVVFLNETLEAPVLTRVLVQRPRPEIFGTRVSGFKLYDLQLFADSRLLVTSHFLAGTMPNPLGSQVSGVFSQIAGGLLKSGVLGTTSITASKGSQALPLENEIFLWNSLLLLPASPVTSSVVTPKLLPAFAISKPVVYIVHLVHLQRPFKAWDSSVIPQISVTDQLSSGVAVDYILNSLVVRSRTEDEAGDACIGDREKDEAKKGKIIGSVHAPEGMTPMGLTVLIIRDSLSRSHPATCMDDPVAIINDNLRGTFLANCVTGVREATSVGQEGFEVPDAAAGRYLIQASATNLGTASKQLTLAPGETQSVEIQLPVGGSASQPDPAACAKALGVEVDDFVHTNPIKGLDFEKKTAAIERVENLYATYVALANPTQLTNPAPSTQYTLGKLTRVSFSLGVAVLGDSKLNTPAKVSSATDPKTMMSINTPVSDTPTNPLTFVALDYHIPRYDETRFSPSFGERFRAFTGIALTPNPGVVGGVGFGIVRGITVEVGYSVLLERTLAKGAQLNVQTMLHNPTPRKGVGALFAGIGYSFQ